MALPASGAISLNQVNVELGNAGTASINMNSAAVRGLFGVASGAISMSDGYGKSNEFSFSITSNQTNANLRTLAVNAGWDQSIAVVATINSGVRMTSNTVGTPGLTINGAWPGGIELVNNGTIVGRGGNGGNGGNGGTANNSTYDSTNGSAGSAGGLALTISVPVSIRNNGTIAGGGGGGGGGGGYAINVGSSKTKIGSNTVAVAVVVVNHQAQIHQVVLAALAITCPVARVVQEHLAPQVTMARVVQAVRHSGKAPEVALAVDGVALVGPGRDTLLEPTQNSEAQAVLLGQLHQGKLMLHGLQREQD